MKKPNWRWCARIWKYKLKRNRMINNNNNKYLNVAYNILLIYR